MEDVLQTAESLGLTPSQHTSSTQPVEGLQQAKPLVEECRRVHELELRISALSRHLASKTVTDQQLLAARAAGLSSAASTLQLVCSNKDAVADHLRSASMRPSVPVAPEYQPDFADMLRCAASNAGALQDGLQVLQWAASLSDKPSCWEDQLRIIRDSAQSIKDCAAAMQEFDSQLTKSSGVGSSVTLQSAGDLTAGEAGSAAAAGAASG